MPWISPRCSRCGQPAEGTHLCATTRQLRDGWSVVTHHDGQYVIDYLIHDNNGSPPVLGGVYGPDGLLPEDHPLTIEAVRRITPRP